MAKSIQAEAKLDAPFDDIDRQKLIEFCKAYGDLSSDFTYEGSERAGYQSGGILSPGVLKNRGLLLIYCKVISGLVPCILVKFRIRPQH